MNCSTPANYFHVLRRQIAMPFRKPVSVLCSEGGREGGRGCLPFRKPVSGLCSEGGREGGREGLPSLQETNCVVFVCTA